MEKWVEARKGRVLLAMFAVAALEALLRGASGPQAIEVGLIAFFSLAVVLCFVVPFIRGQATE